jgi:CheY-like chemotaxis protein
MRRPKALVIDNDLRIVDEVAEIFTSLGHTYQCAPNLEAARKAIRAKQFSYVLLNLDVPARSKGGTPHFQNGINLLEELCGPHQSRRLPVIVLLGQRLQRSMPMAKIVDLVVALMQKGAASVIRKPLTDKARMLDRAIKKALTYHHTTVTTSPRSAPQAAPAAPRCFDGGEMTFYPDRVELCGVKIISDAGAGQSLMMLRALTEKHPDGRFRSLSAEVIAKRIDADGVGAVTSCAATIRKNTAERLRAQLNIVCGKRDVLENDEQGYRLREWIDVRIVDDEGADGEPLGSAEPVTAGSR